MDTSTIIIAMVMLLVCIVPVVLLNRAGKKNAKNNEEIENNISK